MAPWVTGRRRPGAGLVLVVGLVIGLAGCSSERPAVTFPPQSFGTRAPTEALDAAAQAVIRAVGARGVQVRDAQVAVRPGESASLFTAPRRVLQALLLAEPDHGFISIYEFADAAAAADAGREMAAYVTSGPGLVQYPNDARFTLRRLGTTLVVYAWSPAAASDPKASEIQSALETVGDAIEVRG